MSRLEDVKNAATSPENLRDILESLGWEDYIAMYAVKNIPYWGETKDKVTGKWIYGWEINPDAVEYNYWDLTEEERKEAAYRMYYDINQ